MQSKLVVCIGIIIIGLISLVSGLFLWKIPAENRVDGPKRKRSAIVDILLGGVFILLGIFSVFSWKSDYEKGYTGVTLRDTNVEYIPTAHRPAGGNIAVSGKKYQLTGTSGGKKYEFEFFEGEISDEICDLIKTQAPEIKVIYYKATKSLVQLQIYLADGSVRVWPQEPAAQGAMEESVQASEDVETVTLLEPQWTDETTLEEIPLENVELYGVKVGDSGTDAFRILCENGYWITMVTPDNVADVEAEKEAIVKEYGISENQTLRILRKDNVQVILVCDKESIEVEQIITRQEM